MLPDGGELVGGELQLLAHQLQIVAELELQGAPRYARNEKADGQDPDCGRRVFDYYGMGLGGPI